MNFLLKTNDYVSSLLSLNNGTSYAFNELSGIGNGKLGDLIETTSLLDYGFQVIKDSRAVGDWSVENYNSDWMYKSVNLDKPNSKKQK